MMAHGLRWSCGICRATSSSREKHSTRRLSESYVARRYQNTWPAVQADCDGCLFVAEAETLQSKSTEIEDKWCCSPLRLLGAEALSRRFRELVLRSVPAGLGAYSALRAHHVFAPGQVGFCAHSTSAESPNQFPDCRLRKYNRDALRLCELAPDLVCDSTGAREYEGV